MKSLIRKNLANGSNNTLYSMLNTYKFFCKKKINKFDLKLFLYFLGFMAGIIFSFWCLYE